MSSNSHALKIVIKHNGELKYSGVSQWSKKNIEASFDEGQDT